MPIQGIGLVLRENTNPLQMRIDTVRQSKIYDSVNPSERHCRFGAMLGQRIQPLSLATSQNEGESILKDGAGAWRDSLQRVFLIGFYRTCLTLRSTFAISVHAVGL